MPFFFLFWCRTCEEWNGDTFECVDKTRWSGVLLSPGLLWPSPSSKGCRWDNQYLGDLDVKFQRFHLIITEVFFCFLQSYGKVVYFITLFPYIVLTTFLIMGLQQVVCWFIYLSQFKFGLDMLRIRRHNDKVSLVISDESVSSKHDGSM